MENINKRMLVWAALLACMLLGLSQDHQLVFSQTDAVYAESISGSIDAPSEIDRYTFEANPGDLIIIGLAKTSGGLWPEIRVLDASADLVVEQSHAEYLEVTVRPMAVIEEPVAGDVQIFLPMIVSDTAPTAGLQSKIEYTILIGDGFDGTRTGGYNLFLQKLNEPINPTELTYNDTVSGSVDVVGELDSFVFSGEAGDIVLAGMSQVLGPVWQQIRLYDPAGNLLNEVAHPTHVETMYTLPSTGEYKMLLSDGFSGLLLGGYNIHLQRINNPVGSVPLVFNELIAGEITAAAERDAYTFTAEADDVVLVSMSKVSEDLWQQVRIFNAAGELQMENSHPEQAELFFKAAESGPYTVLVADGFNTTKTGSYHLFSQRINNPSNPIALASGETLSGTIDKSGEEKTYVYSSDGNESLILSMAGLSGDMWVRIRLFDPAGTLIADNTHPSSAEIQQTLTEAGEYTILLKDGFNGTQTGEFSISATSVR